MKSVLFILLFFVASSAASSESHHHHHHHHKCKIQCPDFNTLTVDLTNDAESDANSLANIERLWNSTYPVLSTKGQALKEAFLYLARSDVQRWRDVALLGTTWIWSNIPQISAKPNFCTATKVINATLAANGGIPSCSRIRDIARSGMNIFMDSTKLLSTAALKNANCCAKKAKQVPKSQCYKDGSVYPIKEYWAKVGPEFPCLFQRAVLNLYKSSSYMDRYMCAIATSSTTSLSKIYFDTIDRDFMFKSVKMLTFGPIDRRCCRKLKSSLSETMSVAQLIADDSEASLIAAFDC